MVWGFMGLDDQTALLQLTVENGGAGRNRTGVNGVAVRCMTTLPPRLLDAGLYPTGFSKNSKEGGYSMD